jgi:hypothetical protein
MIERDVRFANPVHGRGWVKLEVALIEMEGLSLGAKMTWAAMSSYARDEGPVWPGQLRLASMLNVSERHIQRYIGELRDRGLVEIKRRGQGKTNLYVLRFVADLDTTPVSSLDTTPVSYEVEEEEVEEVLLPSSASLQRVEAPVVRNETVASMGHPDDIVVAENLQYHVSFVTGRNSRAVPTKADYNVARLIREKDGFKQVEILYVLQWLRSGTERSEFWKLNVLSMTKLRKHMPRLLMEIEREINGPPRAKSQAQIIAEHYGAPYIGDQR